MASASRRMRVGGAFGYLLLVAVLTFGVFAMHTMGHPEHSSGSGTDGALHSLAGRHQGDMTEGATGITGTTGSTGTPDPRTSAEAAAMADHEGVSSAAPSIDEPVISMDVMSVCVAVLTGWLLWLFLCAAARRKERLTALLARAMAVLPPLPPPPRPLLAQLSVLRI